VSVNVNVSVSVSGWERQKPLTTTLTVRSQAPARWSDVLSLTASADPDEALTTHA